MAVEPKHELITSTKPAVLLKIGPDDPNHVGSDPSIFNKTASFLEQVAPIFNTFHDSVDSLQAWIRQTSRPQPSGQSSVNLETSGPFTITDPHRFLVA
jgi:hypothetical protein